MNSMAQYGRGGDTMMGHLTPGEMVIPKPVMDSHPEVAAHIAALIKSLGGDPDQYVVGDDNNSVNPSTGQPEFGWFSKIFKSIKRIAPVALLAAGGLGLAGIGPLAGTLGGGGSLLSGLGTASKVLSTVNTAKGLFSGGSSSKGDGSFSKPVPVQKPAQEEFTPARPSEMSAPQSLNEFAGFSPEQTRSALATRGNNIGLGADENAYYRNLLQRSLIGDGGQVNQGNQDFLMPVEGQYFNKQGVDTSNILNFLKGIRG